MKWLFAVLCAASVIGIVGCSQKPDVGDANVQLKPGQAKLPGASAPPGASGSGPSAPASQAPAMPKAP